MKNHDRNIVKLNQKPTQPQSYFQRKKREVRLIVSLFFALWSFSEH